MKAKILAVGEILWDLLPGGKQLGGAPANFAFHAHSLGADVHVVSSIGNDVLGHEILEQLRALGVPVDGISTDTNAPTGTVSVDVAADGQPRFTIHENVAWDGLVTNDESLAFAAQADAVCFGSLGQRSERSRCAVRRLVAATPTTALRVFDINLRQHFHSRETIEESLVLANVLKLNDAELPVLAAMFGFSGDVGKQLVALGERFKLHTIALTRGANGSLLLSRGAFSDHPGLKTPVVDTVGAGDAFTAAMTVGLLAGRTLKEINERANELAAYVCSQPGAMPIHPSTTT